MKTFMGLVVAAAVLAACHPAGSYTERGICVVDGKTIIYDATRRYGTHGSFSEWVSWIGNSTRIRDDNGEIIIKYSAGIPCSLQNLNYRPD